MIHTLSHGLALALLAGPWSRVDLRQRAEEALGARPPWLGPLLRRVLARFATPPVDGEVELTDLLAQDSGLREAVMREGPDLRIRHWLLPEAAMASQVVPLRLAVPPLPSVGDLAMALTVSVGQLAWFADRRRINASAEIPALSHYRWRWLPKASGGYRLLEAPKTRLKAMQRWILRHVLAAVPPAAAAHGFVHGRNVRSFAQAHAGRAVVVRLDLQDFFAAVGRGRVAAIFRKLGYPREVAATFAGLCTVVTPEAVLGRHPREGADLGQRFLTNQRLRDAHLPQGAPTSPALANLAAFHLDVRLGGLARGFGATMTRYADDIAFSGDRAFDRALPHFLPLVGAIALEEGFHINYRKTLVMRQSERQLLCGLVVNDRPNVPRSEYDRLRAILHNALRLGLASQNREGHADFRRYLEGRISWMSSIHPARGRRLRELFQQVPR